MLINPMKTQNLRFILFIFKLGTVLYSCTTVILNYSMPTLKAPLEVFNNTATVSQRYTVIKILICCMRSTTMVVKRPSENNGFNTAEGILIV